MILNKCCHSLSRSKLNFLPFSNQIKNHYSTFKPVNIEEVRNEFRAYGNGRIDFKTENDIGIIKLDYPEKKNAISGKMMAEFYDILTSLENRHSELRRKIRN